ncbi:MAG: hypothetical protein ACYDCH_12515 [Gaiellaceae bacterium]
MGDKRLSNSELKLNRLEEDEPRRAPDDGVYELFDPPVAEPDEDAPLARDDAPE